MSERNTDTTWEDFHPLSEQVFLPMLAQERKRSERSGKPFILLLLRGNGAFLGDRGNDVVSRICHAMHAATRETDVLGWYEAGEVLGIIFTELGELASGSIETILTRITAALSEDLNREDLDSISITCHVYPEQTASNDSKNLKLFYPETKSKRPARRVERLLKRSVDVAGSLFAILVLSPVFAVVALIVKFTSEGPVLFRQKRVGQFGEPFTFLKFRSMYINNDASAHQEYVKKLISGGAEKHEAGSGGAKVFKIANDPRITPIGRFIRKTSLDELPQFFNVLRGDMSLVGPRPPVPYEYECYDIWHRKRVFEVKPGITGLWQVTGRSKTSFDDMVRLDLKYVRTWSIWLDLKILVRTPWVMVSGDGGY